MSLLRLILASLAYHRRIHFAVACGVAAGTAVLVGALLVGDSMRGSLRRLTLERLGRVEESLVSEHFFRAALAEEVAAAEQLPAGSVVPVILLRLSLENPNVDPPARVNQVNLIGCDERFWAMGDGPPPTLPKQWQIVLNAPLAAELGIAPGQEALLRLPRPTSVPPDSPLGHKDKERNILGRRVEVIDVVPAAGFGRFSLSPNQQEPYNAYVSLEWLQDQLDESGHANVLLASSAMGDADPAWRLRPEDCGLRVQQTRRGYINISSRRLIVDRNLEQEVLAGLRHPDVKQVQPALTYLANTIACRGNEIPYSAVAAVDFLAEPPLGPMVTPEGKPIPPLKKGEIALNSWAVDQLGAKLNDTVRLDYFDPETVSGEVRQQSREFRLAAEVKLEGLAADRDFLPPVPGLTDRRDLADWQAPFPFDRGRVRQIDEDYWRQYRGTPKAFISLEEGQEIWGSRFGRTTTIRVAPSPGGTARRLEQDLSLDPRAVGMTFQPIRRQGLAAAAGTTDFEWLFLGFSFFIIAAAAMLVALLFRLGTMGRAAEVGILTATGFPRRQIAAMFLLEGLAVAWLGGVLGIGIGIAYAALMLAGLKTLWLGAVVAPFLDLYITPKSLVLGYAIGFAVAAGAIAAAVRGLTRRTPRQLLAGQIETEIAPRAHRGLRLPLALLILALLLGVWAMWLDAEAQAGAFFGAGALVLAAALVLVWRRLAAGATGPAVAPGRGNVARLAMRNAARHPGRSTLTIGLVAAATFLIVAIGAFRIDPSAQSPKFDSGNGGFSLVAESDLPIYAGLNSSAGREKAGITPDDETLLADATVLPFRMNPGDDASCLNLYRPQKPRVLGVPNELIDRGGFAWSAAAKGNAEEQANPWLLLRKKLDPDAEGVPRLPIVLDANTAVYSLHLGGSPGATLDIAADDGRPLRLEVVGLLKGSVFQGDVLMADDAFIRYFPSRSGFRFFLIDCPPERTEAISRAMQRDLGDYGLAVETSGRRLARFLAVQNTYLSTFQTLGGLGLLLGTFGLAAVQLRSVLERRRELALLRAVGFRRRTLAWLLVDETALLLAGGLLAGLAAALVAVLPHWILSKAAPPWLSLTLTLAGVATAGLLSAMLAVRSALRQPLLESLRRE